MQDPCQLWRSFFWMFKVVLAIWNVLVERLTVPRNTQAVLRGTGRSSAPLPWGAVCSGVAVSSELEDDLSEQDLHVHRQLVLVVKGGVDDTPAFIELHSEGDIFLPAGAIGLGVSLDEDVCISV